MTDLRERFASLDRLAPPADLWADIERRASARGLAAPQPVTATMPTWRNGQPGLDRRFVLALTALVVVLAALAVAIGGVMDSPLRADVPPIIAEASPAPDVAASADPSPVSSPSGAAGPSATWSGEWWDVPRGKTFTSATYDYSIAVPSDWVVHAAADTWQGSGDWAAARIADRLIRPQELVCPPSGSTFPNEPDECSLSVAAADVPAGIGIDTWITTHVPERAVVSPPSVLPSCLIIVGAPTGSITLPASPNQWVDGTIGGRPARLRAQCGFVDGVVQIDGQAYVFSMFQGYQEGGDLYALEGVTSTVVFGATTAPEVTPETLSGPSARWLGDWWDVPRDQAFTSPRHGYLILIPSDWQARAATSDWDGEGTWDGDLTADHFVRPRGLECPPASQTLRLGRDVCSLAVAATEVPAGTIDEAWIAAHVPERPVVSHDPGDPGHPDCLIEKTGERIEGAYTEEWVDGTIGGRPARIRAQCGFVDGVTIFGRMAYVFSMFQGFQQGGDRAALEGVTRSVAFLPRQWSWWDRPSYAASASFVSPLYDYSLIYPAGWAVTPATTEWSGSGEWDLPAIADIFDPPEEGPEKGCEERGGGLCVLQHLAVAATDVAAGTTVDQWIARHVPERLDVRRGDRGEDPLCMIRAAHGNFMVDAADGAWVDGTIGGRPARIRAQCGFVEGVVIVDRRAYIFSMFTEFDPGGDPLALESLTEDVTFSPT